MPLQVTARRPGCTLSNMVDPEEYRRDLIKFAQRPDDSANDLVACLQSPRKARRIWQERQEKMEATWAKRLERIAEAEKTGEAYIAVGERRAIEFERYREEKFAGRLEASGINYLPLPSPPPSDRATRFRGTKRPFMGEKIEEDAVTTTLVERRSKKRKSDGPYPSPPPSPPSRPRKKHRLMTRRQRQIWDENNNDNGNNGYEAINPKPRVPLLEPLEVNVGFREVNWNQPEGTGPGLNDLVDPDPIYQVRRINCRLRIPGTNLTAYWENGNPMVTCGPGWRPWLNPRARARGRADPSWMGHLEGLLDRVWKG
ncbi:MAG: hypothetical protein Q9166_000261 [cf. Caloplaca sp. 2 TL-2023]